MIRSMVLGLKRGFTLLSEKLPCVVALQDHFWSSPREQREPLGLSLPCTRAGRWPAGNLPARPS